MSLGPARDTRDRARRSVLGEIVQDLVRQWARASHARALANARRAATAASAAGVQRAEVDAWLEAQYDDRDDDRRDDRDEVGAGV